MQKTSIIVPCYNEENRLYTNLFITFIKQNPDIHFLFVNDGSTDNTLQLIKSIKNDNINFLNLNTNVGKAEAVRLGILNAYHENKFDRIGFIDADLSTPLEEIPILLKYHNSKILFTFGSRIKKIGSSINRRLYRHILGRIFATIVSSILKLNVYDTQCGLKIFDTSIILQLFKTPFISKWIFDVEIFYRFKKTTQPTNTNLIAKEIAINKWEDVSGSKLNLLDFLKVPFELIIFYIKKDRY